MLSPDQDDALKQNLLKSFGAPQMPPPPIGGSSFDVNSMGPNLDTTLKSAGQAPSPTPPLSDPAMANPAPPLPSAPIAPPPPATPTGAPMSKDIDPKIGPSHPGMNEDQIAQYLASQKAQLNKYGPDQEKAVMDEIRKRQHGLSGVIGDKMAQASDDIMQGVARAGSGQSMARRQQAKENELSSTLQEQQDLAKNNRETIGANQAMDAMDHNSPIGKAMMSTWGPLLDKLGVPKDKQAAMIPSLVQNMTPELVKRQDSTDRLSAARLQKEGMMGYRQDTQDQNNWVKLGDRVNALTAGSRKALGISASNNMRADRLIQTAGNKDITPQDISNLTADLQGIYKGGTPDETMQKHGNYATLQQDAGKILGYISSNPAKANSPEVVQHLKKLAIELKQIDNKVINDNLGINAVTFKPLIDKDPERWHDMVKAVDNTTSNPGGATAMPTAAGPYGETVVKDGKNYRWNSTSGKYHPE